MYDKILSAKPDGSSVVFIDIGASCSRSLLLGYVLHRLQQQVAVTLVPSGQSPAELPGWPLLARHPLTEPDQPGRWQSAEQLAARLWVAVPPAGPPAALLVLEDASCLLHWLGVGRLCRLVQQVKAAGHQLVLSVSEEAAGDDWLAQLRHYATHVVSVEGTGRELTVSTTSRSRTGKVESAVERVCLDAELQVTRVEPCRPQPASAIQRPAAGDSGAQLAPGLTTFSLHLSEQERQTRSQLVLPYLRPEQGAESESGPGGQIFYQPDAADDWDEEDPDDDLDI